MAEYNDIHPPTCHRCQAPVQHVSITPLYAGKGITVGVRCHGETQDVLLTWQEMLDYDGATLRAVLADRLTILAPPVHVSLSPTPRAQTPPPHAAQWVRGDPREDRGHSEWLPIDDAVVAAAQQMGWHYTPSTWVPPGGSGHDTPRCSGTHTLITEGGSIQSPVLPPKKEP